MKKFKVIFGLIIVVILVLIMFFTKNNNNFEDNIDEVNDNVETIVKQENTTKNVAIVGTKNLIINANTKDVEVNFVNPIENEGLYYQTFELRLLNDEETGYEVLYKSDMVEPGREINEITLAREIEKGEYDAILYVQPYRMDEEKTPTNDAKIKIKLIAE